MTDAPSSSSLPEPIWRPSAERVERAGLTRYLRWLERERGLRFEDYESLWQWSVDDVEAFWASMWDFFGIRAQTPYSAVLGKREMPGADWFPGATLNYAEHLLAHAERPDAATRLALVFQSECVARTEVSWSTLAGQVGALGRELRSLGIQPGDRIASYMPNIPATVAAMLATTSQGAIWSSCSPDMGATSVLDRFKQIEPRVLFAVDGYRYGGKDHDRRELVCELVAQLPSVEAVIFVRYLDAGASLELDSVSLAGRTVRVIEFAEVVRTPEPPRFVPVPFSHPLWIVYSSGTTGMPKPIVHGHGGTVIESLKGTVLHLDVDERDRFFWFSSTGWIMWNLWVSTLATGCTALQFDGNPGWPDLTTLWRFMQQEKATFMGLSPAFVGLNMKAGIRPNAQFDLSSIRTVGATGSPLTEEGYRWIYANVNADVMLASISGGTDPGAAFLTSCPLLPVYPGEMQARGLGVAVYAYDDDGKPVMEQVGELTVAKSLPSMPLYFWGDTDGRRYFDSYFDIYPGCWRHGDWLKLIRRPESVTSVIFGRSDSTINRHGIRMGTSELYRVVEEFDEVADSLVIDLEYLGRPSFLALFIVLRSGSETVPAELRDRLLAAIRTRLSARHVPNDVFAIREVPRTLSGKKLEVPVKKILLGQPVEKSVNRDSMANPGAIDWFIAFGRTLDARLASGG